MPHIQKRGCNHRATSRKHKGSQREGTEKVSGRSGLSSGATHAQKSGLPPWGRSEGNPRLAKARASCWRAPRTPFFGRLGPRHLLLVPLSWPSRLTSHGPAEALERPGASPPPGPKARWPQRTSLRHLCSFSSPPTLRRPFPQPPPLPLTLVRIG